MPSVDSEIDRLYQVPLAEFTAERNALSKRAGGQAAEIRALQKPTVPAWAVNQLYWKERRVYDELIERADDLRATHNATLRGRRTDLRGASRAHEEAFETALKTTLTLLGESGHAVTDATRQAIATTLRALPGDEPTGRLTRQLEPRGFEMLAGAAAQGRVRPATPEAKPSREVKAPREAGAPAATAAAAKAAAARLAAARDAATAAARAARDAEHVVRREEFEAARAAREAEKAVRRVTEAEEALQQAESQLAEAKRAAAAAEKARDAATKRAGKAADELKAARDEEDAAKKKVDALT